MKQSLIDLINEQIVHAQENFVTNECQIADGWPQALYHKTDGDEQVIVDLFIKGDDSNDYWLYLLIDVEEEEHTLISKSELDAFIDDGDFEDISNEIPDL